MGGGAMNPSVAKHHHRLEKNGPGFGLDKSHRKIFVHAFNQCPGANTWQLYWTWAYCSS
jgi:hypothetical protein